MAVLRSADVKEEVESSRSRSFFFLPLVVLCLFLSVVSPHMLEPPWVYGMLRTAMPCKDGPLDRSRETPSHYIWGIGMRRVDGEGKQHLGRKTNKISLFNFFTLGMKHCFEECNNHRLFILKQELQLFQCVKFTIGDLFFFFFEQVLYSVYINYCTTANKWTKLTLTDLATLT